MGAILSAALMLEHLGFGPHSARIDAAVRRAIGDEAMTPDLGGRLSTAEVGACVRRHL